jgi:hypothetical protein
MMFYFIAFSHAALRGEDCRNVINPVMKDGKWANTANWRLDYAQLKKIDRKRLFCSYYLKP